MVIEDLIILGRACPEPLKNGRVTVCLAGWSDSQGFVRLYPTKPDLPWRQWDKVRVEVEKPSQDNRLESWKIVGSRSEWQALDHHISIVGKITDREQRRSLVANLLDKGLHTIQQDQRSLGILQPQILRAYFAENPFMLVLGKWGCRASPILILTKLNANSSLSRVSLSLIQVVRLQADNMTFRCWNGVFMNGLERTQKTKSRFGRIWASVNKNGISSF